MTNRAIVVGASGLIGSKLLTILLNKNGYDEVLSISRKKLKLTNSKLTQLIVDFDHLENYKGDLKGGVIFCCLGSTLKKTPDLNDYRKIDHDYPVELAKLALQNGVEQYHLVSSIGANARSSNFYTRMKGETEADIEAIGLKSLHIYQPSQLIGHRKTPRLKERVALVFMKIIGPLLLGKLKKYKAIPAETVARAMYKQSLKNEKGVFVYTSDKIKQLA